MNGFYFKFWLLCIIMMATSISSHANQLVSINDLIAEHSTIKHDFATAQQHLRAYSLRQASEKGIQWLTPLLWFPAILMGRKMLRRNKKNRRRMNESEGDFRGLYALPAMVTLIVAVMVLSAGGTGMGGFIWIWILPLLLLMWLGAFALVQRRRRKTE